MRVTRGFNATHTGLTGLDRKDIERSQQLSAMIQMNIQKSGGLISFSRFMELALYAPQLGYYSAGSVQFGPTGDFATAPEIGQLYAATWAQCFIDLWPQLNEPADFLELGAGSGRFAKILLEAFAQSDIMPRQYLILEPSLALRHRQRTLLMQQLDAQLMKRVVWIEQAPHRSWQGIVFANEVIDALPVTRFYIHNQRIHEEMIGIDHSGQWVRQDRDSHPVLEQVVQQIEDDLPAPFPEGYRSECLPELSAWISSLSANLERGALFFVDYGYPRREYYRADRSDGTLRAFFRQKMYRDVYQWPGLLDLTASVDFTALAQAGADSGLELVGYCPQSQFLLTNRIDRFIEAAQTNRSLSELLPIQAEAKRLLRPDQMGELYQVMGFSRGINLDSKFHLADWIWRL